MKSGTGSDTLLKCWKALCNIVWVHFNSRLLLRESQRMSCKIYWNYYQLVLVQKKETISQINKSKKRGRMWINQGRDRYK